MPAPSLVLRLPVSLGNSGHPRKTTTTTNGGNDEPSNKTDAPVEEPAAPAQVPHTLETLLEQALGPDAVRFHSVLIIIDG
jgi:hypothetical protein